jgi:hypothetical protein
LRAGWLAERPRVQVEQPVADQAGRRPELLRGDLLLVRALLAQKLLAQGLPTPVMPTRTILVRTARKRTRAPEKTGLARAAVVPEEQAALQVRWIPEHSKLMRASSAPAWALIARTRLAETMKMRTKRSHSVPTRTTVPELVEPGQAPADSDWRWPREEQEPFLTP